MITDNKHVFHILNQPQAWNHTLFSLVHLFDSKNKHYIPVFFTCSEPQVGLSVEAVAPESRSLWAVRTTLTCGTTHTVRLTHTHTHTHTLVYIYIYTQSCLRSHRPADWLINTDLSDSTGQSSAELFSSWRWWTCTRERDIKKERERERERPPINGGKGWPGDY